MKKAIAALVMTAFIGASAQAGIILATANQTDFVNATGATAVGPIPQTASGSDFSVGPLSFTGESPSTLNASRNWSDLISEPFDLAVNGQENFNVTSSVDLYAFGFDFSEPTVNKGPNDLVDSCNATCEASLFYATLYMNNVQVDFVAFFGVSFVGVQTDVAFNRIEFREAQGGIDNEFFGNFLISTERPATVPAPAALGLLGLGLAGLGLYRRRRA